MYSLLLATACALFAFVAWRDLKAGVLFLAAALPSYLLRFEVAGVPSTLLELLFGILFVVFLHRRGRVALADLTHALSFGRRGVAPYLPFILIFLAAAIGTAVSPVSLSALGLLKAYVVEPMLLFLVVRDLFSDEADRARLLRAVALGGAFAALVAIAQYALNAGIPVPWDLERRVTGPFPYPNALGLYLAPIITIAGVYLLSVIARRPKADEAISSSLGSTGLLRSLRSLAMTGNVGFWSVVFLLCSVAVFLSKTEAAWASVPFVLLVAARRLNLRAHRGLTSACVVAATVAILAVTLVPAIRGPVVEKLTLQDASGQVRVAQWQETAAFLRDDHWLLGAGLAGYPTAIEPYHVHPEYEIFQDPHNVILNIWVELGLLGLVATCLVVIGVWHAEKKDWVAAAASLALLQMVIHGLVDVPFFKNDLAMMTFLLLALVAAEVKPRQG